MACGPLPCSKPRTAVGHPRALDFLISSATAVWQMSLPLCLPTFGPPDSSFPSSSHGHCRFTQNLRLLVLRGLQGAHAGWSWGSKRAPLKAPPPPAVHHHQHTDSHHRTKEEPLGDTEPRGMRQKGLFYIRCWIEPRRPVHQEHTTILRVYVPNNRASRYKKQ